jgi:hypothetical protein
MIFQLDILIAQGKLCFLIFFLFILKENFLSHFPQEEIIQKLQKVFSLSSKHFPHSAFDVFLGKNFPIIFHSFNAENKRKFLVNFAVYGT